MSESKNFFAELKRRHVYRVAVAFAVVGWLLIQIATSTFPILEIPTWATRLVIVLVAIGLPIALILAWAFELTPEGIKRTDDLAPSGSLPLVHLGKLRHGPEWDLVRAEPRFQNSRPNSGNKVAFSRSPFWPQTSRLASRPVPEGILDVFSLRQLNPLCFPELGRSFSSGRHPQGQ